MTPRPDQLNPFIRPGSSNECRRSVFRVAHRKFNGKPKRSAERVAALRFAGSFEDDPNVRGPDRLVGSLLNWRFRTVARFRVLP